MSFGLPPGEQVTADAFSAAIEHSDALDSGSPDALEARLRFAHFLAEVDDGDCPKRLDEAQKQLETARTKPTFGVALPAGLARAAAAEYQIHLARSGCAGDPLARERELRAALDAARRSVELYRDAFDAASMVTMQFNSSIVYRNLGDNPAAVAALQSVIAMDREYGYRDDAEENYRLLLEWNNEESGPNAVAARMQDFPERSSTLKFAWFDSVASVSLQSEFVQVIRDENLQSRATVAAQRTTRRRVGRWGVSYQTGSARYDLEPPSAGDTTADGFAAFLTHMLVHLQDFDVDRNGTFDEMTGRFKYIARVRADAAAMIDGLASRNDLAQLQRRLHDVVKAAVSPGFLESAAAEGYELETGTWIGATLDQGVWYDMSIPLSLPVAPGVIIAHKVEFAYTRQVPCTAATAELACVEIVLHAVPDPALLKTIVVRLARAWHLPGGQPRAWSSTYMRLVVDPHTLMPYLHDMRLYSYWPTSEAAPNRWLALSEKDVFVTESITPVTEPAAPAH